MICSEAPRANAIVLLHKVNTNNTSRGKGMQHIHMSLQVLLIDFPILKKYVEQTLCFEK